MRARFPNLVLSESIERVLAPHPFNLYVIERSMELLTVLQQYLESRDDNGRHTANTRDLLARHFSGGKAWFTDESATNKRAFKNELTFPDPIDPTAQVFCPWHGKIKTPQYRIHFAWPIEAADRVIRVVYIGPKITRG